MTRHLQNRTQKCLNENHFIIIQSLTANDVVTEVVDIILIFDTPETYLYVGQSSCVAGITLKMEWVNASCNYNVCFSFIIVIIIIIIMHMLS